MGDGVFGSRVQEVEVPLDLVDLGLVSEDLDEVFGVSDRIAVMYEGQVMGLVDPKTATREEVGLMMAGVSKEQAVSGG